MAKKMPLRYEFDYGLFRDGQLLAIAEIKCRSQKYDTLFVSLAKYINMLTYSRAAGVTALLVVNWSGDIQYIPMTVDRLRQYRIEMGGRVDRGDEQDQEPVVHIPVANFKKLERDHGERGIPANVW